MKNYEVTIYGRSNSIYRGLQNTLLYDEVVQANNQREAERKAWDAFASGNVLSVADFSFLRRVDVRIESELCR